MKKLVSKIFCYVPFIKDYYSGIATIFMLHRVHPFEDEKLLANENLKISPEFLEGFIIKLKENNYKFISLDELFSILKKGKKVKNKIVLTLDDGYQDNYKIAYPIFKKHNIPFTIYITTSFPENKAIIWWYILEDLILEHDEIKLSKNRSFISKTKIQKEKVFWKINSIILSFSKNNFLNNMNDLFSEYKIDWHQKTRDLAISWEQITELSNNDLCTIAGHTSNHYALKKLQKDEIIDEIITANKLIESKINKPVNHFCYPFGSRNAVGQDEFDLIKDLGFKTSTTTRRGNIYHQHKNHLECLPRIMLTENFDIKSIGQINRKRVVTV